MRKTHPHSTRSTALRRAAGVLAAFVLAACSSTGDTITAPLRSASGGLANNTGEGTGFVRVCKAAGPSGTYTFRTTATGGGAHVINFGQGSDASVLFEGTEVCVNSGSYIPIGGDPSWTAGMTAQVSVTELVPAGIEVDKIEVWDVIGFPPVLTQTITGSATATVTVTSSSRIKILYYNKETPPPPPSGAGCTPGYWKVDVHHDSWAATGYSTGQSIGSVFSNASIFGLHNNTLLQGLNYGGGSTLREAAMILLRASIAAVLNAAHPDVNYALSAADIVTSVNAALASGSRSTILGLATQLDDENNRGCTLD